jgi:hypothetical protein
MDFVASLLPRPKRKKMRDTWHLIDLKLGPFDVIVLDKAPPRRAPRRCSSRRRTWRAEQPRSPSAEVRYVPGLWPTWLGKWRS